LSQRFFRSIEKILNHFHELFRTFVKLVTCPIKRVHLKDQIMHKLKGGRNTKKRF
jgi:hypothetical protein